MFFNAVMCLRDADGMANNVDPDQTFSSLILISSTFSYISVLIFQIFMVHYKVGEGRYDTLKRRAWPSG